MKCVSNVIRTNTTILTNNSISVATTVANESSYNSIKTLITSYVQDKSIARVVLILRL